MAKTKKNIEKYKNEDNLKVVNSILIDGNKSTFSILEKKYSKIIASLIRKMIKDEDDVADLTQETFIKAFNALPTYKSEYSFSSWIFRIASNGCIDFLRKKRFPTISLNKPMDSGDDDLYIDIEDTDTTPDIRLINDERKNIIAEAVEALPDNYKRIIKMRHFEELDYGEISEKLDIPLGTVKANLFRARKILMISLKKHSHILTD